MLTAHSGFGRNYGRSMVISRQGIVATSHALASQAGAQILAQGGSAVDAAIAANATLGVIEPMMNGIGGDLFVLYWDAKTGQLTGLNASGPAPRGLSPAFLGTHGVTAMPPSGIHSVTVPGAVDGWSKLHQRFGKLAWRQLFEFAIAFAEDGFPVTEALQELWASPASVDRLATHAESARVFLANSKPPRLAELFRNSELARAYRLLAEQGPRAFYEGEIAAAILNTSRGLAGTMTAEDLASFSAEWVAPISIHYRGWKIHELPPNCQGLAALEMLNIMETFPPAPDGPYDAAELHKRIEAMKLAYADAYRYNADPRTCDVPTAQLLSKDYARRRAALIHPSKARRDVVCGEVTGSDTIYLAVVDRQGNIASWIQSIYGYFGSGITVERMGFVLQNRGAGFTLDPHHPNVLAGGKRPYHTIIPGFMERDERHIGFGIMGAQNQPLAQAQFVSNLADYGMNLQEALEAPRFFTSAPLSGDVSMEARVPLATTERLAELGHRIERAREYTQEAGRGQAVMRDSNTATNYAASDPRTDGCATPEPIRP